MDFDFSQPAPQLQTLDSGKAGAVVEFINAILAFIKAIIELL